MKSIEKYGVFEVRISAADEPVVTFSHEGICFEVTGFQISEHEYAVRFMPGREGVWEYHTGDISGTFLCTANTGINHGPVVTEGLHFRYADGAKFCPVGTTCYAWIHQTPELIAETLDSLKAAPFNKIRMCLFPKHYDFNKNDPAFYPFKRNDSGEWDVTRPDFDFWNHLDKMIESLSELGIEADLILFHPYDSWGFSRLSREDSLTYLRYCVRRLSAYRNVWWSFANEYDLMIDKTDADWQAFGELVSSEDSYGHLMSVHNFLHIFPKTKWLTHCSIQHSEVKKALLWRQQYQLPVIIDECGYEGNIPFDWGNLSAFEMVHRAWTAVVCGGCITHGETYYNEDEVLWWSKGGKLHGESPARFAFLKSIQYEIGELNPSRMIQNPAEAPELQNNPDIAPLITAISRLPKDELAQFMVRVSPMAGSNSCYRLHYYGRSCPCYQEISLPQNGSYRIEIIDIWEMTRTTSIDNTCGHVRITLPGKEGIAVLITRLSGDELI